MAGESIHLQIPDHLRLLKLINIHIEQFYNCSDLVFHWVIFAESHKPDLSAYSALNVVRLSDCNTISRWRVLFARSIHKTACAIALRALPRTSRATDRSLVSLCGRRPLQGDSLSFTVHRRGRSFSPSCRVFGKLPIHRGWVRCLLTVALERYVSRRQWNQRLNAAYGSRFGKSPSAEACPQSNPLN